MRLVKRKCTPIRMKMERGTVYPNNQSNMANKPLALPLPSRDSKHNLPFTDNPVLKVDVASALLHLAVSSESCHSSVESGISTSARIQRLQRGVSRTPNAVTCQLTLSAGVIPAIRVTEKNNAQAPLWPHKRHHSGNKQGNCECPAGFEGDARSTGCQDADECARSPCGRDALCSNMAGSFRCACPPGYVGDPFDSCTDVDECTSPGSNPCTGRQTECVNTVGSYECRCPSGYTTLSDQQCEDVNECGRANSCGINAKCINVPGSYKCLCPQGFSGHGRLFCENVDECKENPCGENALCTDTVGSYLCTCKEDYTGDPFKGCVDINECVALEKPCGTNAICENAVPGYNCLCPQGYSAKPDASVACEQIDVNILCKSNFDCVNNAECVDGQCFCQDGFVAQGALCADVDECHANPCGPYSLCTNTPGGYHCECETGYVGAPPRMKCKGM
ncbi:unnamed protein product, partial [Timema podura]|nr:unnamed protein product [Timema podura]